MAGFRGSWGLWVPVLLVVAGGCTLALGINKDYHLTDGGVAGGGTGGTGGTGDTGGGCAACLTCSGGTSNPADAGTSCALTGGANGVCDGMGACVECNADKDCTDASASLCRMNHCVSDPCKNGQKDGTETDIDCGGQCGATCTTSHACSMGGDCVSLVCTNNQCASPSCTDGKKNGMETDVDCGGGAPCPVCPAGMQCGAMDSNCASGTYCDISASPAVCTAKKAGGTACSAAAQCVSGFCADGVCCNQACTQTCYACNQQNQMGSCTYVVSGPDPGTCDSPSTCSYGMCHKPIGQPCSSNQECSSGYCSDGVCCSSNCYSFYTCQSCNVAGSVGMCIQVPSGQSDPDSCPAPSTCNGSGTCILGNGNSCSSASQCLSGKCVDNVCCDTTCTGTCMACNLSGKEGKCSSVQDGQPDPGTCNNPSYCNAGACFKSNSSPCSASTECQSGFCTDGVCCNSACAGTCISCNVSGYVGTCHFVPNGQPDPGTCDSPLSCNGSGMCQ